MYATTDAPLYTDDKYRAFNDMHERYGLDLNTLEECSSVFDGVDLDGSGWIEFTELRALLEKSGGPMTDEEFTKTCEELDSDKDSRISFEEFVAFFCATNKQGVVLEKRIQTLAATMQKKMAFNRRSPYERALQDGVKRTSVDTFLAKEIKEMSACLELPFTFLMLLGFLGVYTLHWRPAVCHTIERSLHHDITDNGNFAWVGKVPYDSGRVGFKNLNDVHYPPDFWSWVHLGIMPLIWRDLMPISEERFNVREDCVINNISSDKCAVPIVPLPIQERSEYLMRNRVIGGLRLRQERRQEIECKGDIPIAKADKCYDIEYSAREDPNIRFGAFLRDDLNYEPYILPVGGSTKEIVTRLRKMEDERWIRQSTQRVQVSLATYNPGENVASITYVDFVFSYGGRAWKEIGTTSFLLNPWDTWATYAFELLWLGQSLKVFVTEAYEVFQHVKHAKWRLVSGIRSYAGFWNTLDWISCLYAAVIVAVFIYFKRQVDRVHDFLRTADHLTEGTWRSEPARFDFFHALDSAATTSERFSIVLSVYVFIVAFRFFKAFAAQPRLAIVTKTLQLAMGDLIHFGVVFGSTIGAFAICAMVLFGHEIAAFSTFPMSLYTCWRLLLGDYDFGPGDSGGWSAMVEIGATYAGTWFVLFTVMVYIVLLNMLLAILMDVYTEVRGSIGGSAETLWSQTHEIFTRWRGARAGTYIPLDRVRSCLDPNHLSRASLARSGSRKSMHSGISLDDMISIDQAVAKVAGLSRSQATDILTHAQALEDEMSHAQPSLSSAMHSITGLQSLTLDLHEKVEKLVLLTSIIAQHQSMEIKSTKEAMPSSRQNSRTPAAREDNKTMEEPPNQLSPDRAPPALLEQPLLAQAPMDQSPVKADKVEVIAVPAAPSPSPALRLYSSDEGGKAVTTNTAETLAIASTVAFAKPPNTQMAPLAKTNVVVINKDNSRRLDGCCSAPAGE